MLSIELNRMITRLAPRHNFQDYAPDTFQALSSQATSSLVVSSLACDKTIYGDTKVNGMFRAWHDQTHLDLGADFSPIGERRVALEQCRIVGGQFADILWAEIVGQGEYFAKYGHFPFDQDSFIRDYLKDSGFRN